MTPNYILVIFTNIVLIVGAITVFFNGYSAKMTGYIMMILGSLFSLVTISRQIVRTDGITVAGIFILYILVMGMISTMIYLRNKYRKKWDVLEENDVKKITAYETYLAIVLLSMMIMMSYITHLLGRPNIVLTPQDMSQFAVFYVLSCIVVAIGIGFVNLIRIITTRFLTDGFQGWRNKNIGQEYDGYFEDYEPYQI